MRDTGKEVWRTYTFPAPANPATTVARRSLENRRRLGLDHGPLRSELNIAYWGTGNPAPGSATCIPATTSIRRPSIALDVDTGKIKGIHQYTPERIWDWDEVSAPLLIDFKRNGRDIQGARASGP